ncbi:hypothetical protein JHK87_002856 [Glycine soja]|nr:hypothetical protein JHK87_002856 [Glycine soja]
MKPYLRPIFLLFLILLDQSISASAINVSAQIKKITEVLNKSPSIKISAETMKLKKRLEKVKELVGEFKDMPPQEICPKIKNAYQQNCPNAAYEAVCPIVKQVYQICCRKHA